MIERHFTGTVFIVEEGRVLLIFHKKLQIWLPPGGHLEANELPHECALREAREETGLEIELVPDEHIWCDAPNASSLLRPTYMLLENLPAHGDMPAHQHIDMIYVGRPIGGELLQNHNETDGLRWFTLEEIEKEPLLFPDTKKMIAQLLSEATEDLFHFV